MTDKTVYLPKTLYKRAKNDGSLAKAQAMGYTVIQGEPPAPDPIAAALARLNDPQHHRIIAMNEDMMGNGLPLSAADQHGMVVANILDAAQRQAFEIQMRKLAGRLPGQPA